MRISDWSSDVCSSDLHQAREDLVGDIGLLDLDLEEAAVLGIERRLPKLFGVHFAEALVALDREALAAGRQDAFEQLAGAADEQIGREACRARVCQDV